MCTNFSVASFPPFRKSSFIFLYAFFWVSPWRLNFICRRFWTLFLLHLHRHVVYFILTYLWRWSSVPKRRHVKFRRRGITQKQAYNIQKKADVWNQEYRLYFLCRCWCLRAVIFRHGKFSVFLQTVTENVSLWRHEQGLKQQAEWYGRSLELRACNGCTWVEKAQCVTSVKEFCAGSWVCAVLHMPKESQSGGFI